MATILDMIKRFVERLAGEPVCHDCLTNRLSLSVRTQANQATRALSSERDFERLKALCALCDATKMVLRRP